MKIQIDLPDNLNRMLKIEKAIRSHYNLEETLIAILDEYFNRGEAKDDYKGEVIWKWRYQKILV